MLIFHSSHHNFSWHPILPLINLMMVNFKYLLFDKVLLSERDQSPSEFLGAGKFIEGRYLK